MNTDRLIDMLSTNLEPVKGVQLWKTLSWAIVIGLVAAFGVMLVCSEFGAISSPGTSPVHWL